MNLLAVGVNHRTAPLSVREQLAIAPRELPQALESLRVGFGIDEAVILSTCNRVECYVTSSHPTVSHRSIEEFLSYRSRLSPEVLRSHLYWLTDREAIAHLFTVTAGLDSMILGESEITAQVKQAYQLAHAQGSTGPGLNRLFQKALHVAKEVRSNTTVGQGAASIGSVVVQLTRELFDGKLVDCQVLLWGAGKAAETTARHLIKAGIGQLWIVNRTQPKAQDLASLCQSGWLSWEQALKHLAHVDIAIVCTQAPHYVIDQGDLERILPQRGKRPLCLIDLAVPRNVDPSLKQRKGVTLYNIDDLQAIAQRGVIDRQRAHIRGATLIEQHVGYFLSRRPHAMTRAQKGGDPCHLIEAHSSR